MRTTQLYKDIIGSDVLNKLVLEGMGRVVIAAIIIAAILYLITLGINVAKNGIRTISGDNDGQFIDYNDLFRTIAIIFLICIYRLLAPAFLGGVNFINEMTALPDERKDNMAQYAENYVKYGDVMQDNMKTIQYIDAYYYSDDKSIKNYAASKLQSILGDDWQQKAKQIHKSDIKKAVEILEKEEEKSNDFIKKSKEALTKIADYIKRLPSRLTNGIVKSIGSIVRSIVIILAALFLRILLIVGPLALAFSIIFRQQSEIWLSAILNLALVHTTINIIDSIAYGIYDYFINAEGISITNYSAMENMKWALLVAYLMVFWLTSKFVGRGDTGRIMSKAVGIATLGVTALAAVGGGKLGGKAGNAIKSQADNTARGVRDAFKDE